MSNPIKRLLGQTAIYGLSSSVGRLLNYLLVPLYTYVFTDPADYGVVSELYAWVAFLIVFLTFGMETAYFRFIQESEDKEKPFRNAFLTVASVCVLFFSALFFFNNEIERLIILEGHNEYIILLGAIVCIDAITAIPVARSIVSSWTLVNKMIVMLDCKAGITRNRPISRILNPRSVTDK